VQLRSARTNWPIYWPKLGHNRSRKREIGIHTGLQSRLHQFDSGRRLSVCGTGVFECNNMSAMKPQAPSAPKTERDKLRFGLPGSSGERKGRIKAAIQANRETLRRLAK
jgi:hypothetical protein